MAVQIEIQGTIVNFPSAGQSPQWANAVIEFAQLVESALLSAVGPFDIAPQTLNIDSYPSATNQVIPNLEFNNSVVRSATVLISTYRTDTIPGVGYSSPAVETQEITIVYNDGNTPTNKWEIARERVGNAYISFSITDAGQFLFSTQDMGTGTHSGVISFSAKALTQV